MSLLIIHEAYMPVYRGSRFALRLGGLTKGRTRGPRGPKKIYGSKMIVRSGAIIHPFSDLVNGRFPPQEAINLNKYTFYKKKFHKVPPPAPPLYETSS